MITAEDKSRALNWLYNKGNPIIKFWAAKRLGVPADEIERLRTEMLRHPDVQYWLGCLLSFREKPALHGSFDTCFENSMRKVLLFGVREPDDARLAEMNARIPELLVRLLGHPNYLDYVVVASYLAAMGHSEPPVLETVEERLDSTMEFLPLGGCDMYADPAGYPKIPAARHGHPLIHPRYYEGNRGRFPLVYDLHAYANLPPALISREDIRQKIDSVMGIVLDESYQRLPNGYGLLFNPPNKYYGMGWSVHLPRFFGEEDKRISIGGSVWWADAMARYPSAVRSDWFRRMLEHLEGFRTEDGFWKFPAAYMTEGPNHYFVGGGHMGLGENRKNRDALKLESTAWMLRIHDQIELQ